MMKIENMILKKIKKIPTQQRSREKVALLLQTAQDIIFQEGLKSLTTNKIAQYSGVTVGSIYQYYVDKEAIIYDVYNSLLQQLYQDYCQYAATHQGENAHDFFLGVIDHFTEKSIMISKLWQQLRSIWITDNDLAALDAEHEQKMVEVIFSDAVRLGVVPNHAHGKRIIRFAFSMLVRTSEMVGEVEKEEKQAYLDYVVFLLHKLLPVKEITGQTGL